MSTSPGSVACVPLSCPWGAFCSQGQAALPLPEQQRSADAAALAKVLMQNTKVKRLDLRINQISNNGAAEIARMLECNSTISLVCLQNNRIGDMGAAKLAKALCQNTGVEVLDLAEQSDWR